MSALRLALPGVGCGNGSIARALAERVAPAGHVVASDIDLRCIVDLQMPCLEIRYIDEIVGPFFYYILKDIVARALLHHLTSARKALERMVSALKPGGVLLSVEPDMLPCTVAEPDLMHRFWEGWLRWSVEAGIDYFVGRKIPVWLDSLGSGGCCGLRAHRAVQRRVRLGNILDRDRARDGALTAEIELCYRENAR